MRRRRWIAMGTMLALMGIALVVSALAPATGEIVTVRKDQTLNAFLARRGLQPSQVSGVVWQRPGAVKKPVGQWLRELQGNLSQARFHTPRSFIPGGSWKAQFWRPEAAHEVCLDVIHLKDGDRVWCAVIGGPSMPDEIAWKYPHVFPRYLRLDTEELKELLRMPEVPPVRGFELSTEAWTHGTHFQHSEGTYSLRVEDARNWIDQATSEMTGYRRDFLSSYGTARGLRRTVMLSELRPDESWRTVDDFGFEVPPVKLLRFQVFDDEGRLVLSATEPAGHSKLPEAQRERMRVIRKRMIDHWDRDWFTPRRSEAFGILLRQLEMDVTPAQFAPYLPKSLRWQRKVGGIITSPSVATAAMAEHRVILEDVFGGGMLHFSASEDNTTVKIECGFVRRRFADGTVWTEEKELARSQKR